MPDKLRKEVLAKVAKEEEKKKMDLQKQLEEGEARTKEIIEERRYLSEKRRVEKELVIDDRNQQQVRLRRVQSNAEEAVRRQIEMKAERIARLQQEHEEEEEQRRKVQAEILRNTTKKAATPTPGPMDYATLDSLHFLRKGGDGGQDVHRWQVGGGVERHARAGPVRKCPQANEEQWSEAAAEAEGPGDAVCVRVAVQKARMEE